MPLSWHSSGSMPFQDRSLTLDLKAFTKLKTENNKLRSALMRARRNIIAMQERLGQRYQFDLDELEQLLNSTNFRDDPKPSQDSEIPEP
jgi:hypothetical protein